MGVGSVIFHATLRYPAQLLDELPLYAMALLAAAVLRQRGARTAGVQPFVAAWCCFLAGSILGSERLTAVHTTMRGVMSVTFALAFVYIFTAANLAASEVDKARRPSMYPIHVVHHMHTYIASHVQCIWTLCVLSALLATISPFALPIHLYPCTHPPTQARGGTDGASLFRATFGCFVGAILASKRDVTLWAVQSRAWAALGPAVQPWCRSEGEAPPKASV